MMQEDGLKNYGNLMIRYDHAILYEWLLLSDWDHVDYVAPAILPQAFHSVTNFGMTYKCYDRDPSFNEDPNYQVCDVVFDQVNLGNKIINFNAHKMYPLGKIYKGEFMIVGMPFHHNGDCNGVNSCEQLIEQNELHTIHETYRVKDYFLVWGRND